MEPNQRLKDLVGEDLDRTKPNTTWHILKEGFWDFLKRSILIGPTLRENCKVAKEDVLCWAGGFVDDI